MLFLLSWSPLLPKWRPLKKLLTLFVRHFEFLVEERRDVFINLPTGFGEERCVTILNDLSEKKKYVFVNLRNNSDTDTGQKKSLKHPRDSHDSYRQC